MNNRMMLVFVNVQCQQPFQDLHWELPTYKKHVPTTIHLTPEVPYRVSVTRAKRPFLFGVIKIGQMWMMLLSCLDSKHLSRFIAVFNHTSSVSATPLFARITVELRREHVNIVRLWVVRDQTAKLQNILRSLLKQLTGVWEVQISTDPSDFHVVCLL